VKSLHVKRLVFFLLWSASLQAASITLSGVVTSDNEKSIASRYMGYIKEVLVDEGSVVKKGDLLYTIDSNEIDTAKVQVEQSIAQAELNVQMYENQYANALLNLERHQRLLQQDMVSKFDVENLELSSKNLKAMLEIAKKQRLQAHAKLKEVHNQYHYLDVRSPSDGVVIAKKIRAGEMALPGVPALVLVDLAHVKILAEVSENHLSSLKLGDKVSFSIRSISHQGEGKVVAIVPNSNALSHSFKVKIAFDTTPLIYPGMYAEVVFDRLNP